MSHSDKLKDAQILGIVPSLSKIRQWSFSFFTGVSIWKSYNLMSHSDKLKDDKFLRFINSYF